MDTARRRFSPTLSRHPFLIGSTLRGKVGVPHDRNALATEKTGKKIGKD